MKHFKKTGLLALVLILTLVFQTIPVQAASPKLNKKSCTLSVGEKLTLKLKNATGKITWTTSSKKVAPVSKKGVVTAKKTGSAIITAEYKNKKYTCVVKVVKGASLNKSKLSLNVGETFELILNNGTATMFVSENEKVATVSSKGVVKAVKKGTTTITALDKKNNSYTCKVTVKAKKSDPSGLDTEENITLTLWDIAVEGDGNRPAYDQALADLKEKYPNITINEVSTENQAYKTKIKSAVAASELPDIFFTWGGAFLGDFVETGKVRCLDDVLQKYIDSGELPEAMLDNSTYGGKHYGVPTTMNVVALFANMDILAEVGYDHIPSTAQELYDCCEKLLEAGITPFTCAGGLEDTWCVTEYLEPIMEKIIGAKALYEIFRGDSTWKNDGIVQAVTVFTEMIEKGYFGTGRIDIPNDEAKNRFMRGKCAFYQNGSWNCYDFSDPENVSFNVSVSEFPALVPGTEGQLIGGPSDTLAVTEGSNTKVAAEYAVELGRLICHYGYLSGTGLPAWTPYGDLDGILPLTRAIADLCSKANGFVLYGDNAISARNVNLYLDCVSRLWSKEIDGEEFVNSLVRDIG